MLKHLIHPQIKLWVAPCAPCKRGKGVEMTRDVLLIAAGLQNFGEGFAQIGESLCVEVDLRGLLTTVDGAKTNTG